MSLALIYSLFSVGLISAVSFLGILFLALKEKHLKKCLLLLVSFSAGGLFGGAFFHLLPEMVEEGYFFRFSPLYILTGIIFSFAVEKIIHWRHCHLPINQNHIHHASLMSLLGDGIHNFLDGLIVAGTYMISLPMGVATTLAVIAHEIPQEIGDFGVLLYGGFSRKKALLINFATALTAFLGAGVAFILGRLTDSAALFILPFAIGTFIYIAGSDLIPELHKECKLKKSLAELFVLILGVGVMFLLSLLIH